ncbi:MAG: hypothetical protein J6Q53_02485 [Oscillospiraceae bacterium]|nr:hypothetical protein [Oscillospiraceae bacterium]
MTKAVKKKPSHPLLFGMLLYAAVFLGLAAGGLFWFWDYMEAYELSRPNTTMNAYIDQLQLDTLYTAAAPLVDQIDPNLQSEAQCRAFIQDTLDTGITFARKLTECTKDKNVYMLLSKGKTIGKVTLSAQSAGRYGLTPWEVTEETFDLSCFMGEALTITVPHDYPVYIGEYRLDSQYIAQDRIPYEALKEFYSNYSLPYMVTYEAGPILGDVHFRVTDPAGNPVTVDEGRDPSTFLDNCTQDEKTQLSAIVHDFIGSYVAFTSGGGTDARANYQKLVPYMVPGSTLAKRMYNAISGLHWTSNRGASITSITIHRSVNIGSDRYLCDVTYIVNSQVHAGQPQTTHNIKLILFRTDDTLKAEAMVIY